YVGHQRRPAGASPGTAAADCWRRHPYLCTIPAGRPGQRHSVLWRAGVAQARAGSAGRQSPLRLTSEQEALRGADYRAQHERVATASAGALISARGLDGAAPQPVLVATGRANQKVDPSPTALSTPTRPPCASTIALRMESPSLDYSRRGKRALRRRQRGSP